MNLVEEIYAVTSQFPDFERYSLSNQMQRAAVSIPSNIAEGHGRDSNAELDRYLRIANGSAFELDTQIEIAFRNEYISESLFYSFRQKIDEITKMIKAFRNSLSQKR